MPGKSLKCALTFLLIQKVFCIANLLGEQFALFLNLLKSMKLYTLAANVGAAKK